MNQDTVLKTKQEQFLGYIKKLRKIRRQLQTAGLTACKDALELEERSWTYKSNVQQDETNAKLSPGNVGRGT